jgi:hypothetical protein
MGEKEMMDELNERMKGTEPLRSPAQLQFGNQIVDAVREGIKNNGMEETANRTLVHVAHRFSMFSLNVPKPLEVGTTITVTEQFSNDWQHLCITVAALLALMAEKAGCELKAEVPPQH